MKENTGLFKKLLDRFRFTGDIPVDTQNLILSSMKEVFVKTLKSVGEYSVLYGAVLGVFFRARRLGMRISIVQSAFILGIVTTLAAITVAAAIALSPQLLRGSIERNNTINVQRDNEKTVPEKKTIIIEKTVTKKPVRSANRNILWIERFSNVNADEEKSQVINESIRSELIRKLGKENIEYLDKRKKKKKINNLLTGSIGKLGDIYMITAKVIDVKRGRSIYITSENVNSENDLKSACRRIAGKIAEKINK